MKFILIFNLLVLANNFFGQGYYDDEKKFTWPDNKPVKISDAYKKFENSDLVILNENTGFKFYINELMYHVPNLDYYGRYTSAYRHYQRGLDYGKQGRITRDVTFKVNTANGLQQLLSRTLPESFDEAYDAGLYKQGRQSRIKIPNIKNYKVISFVARKFSNNVWKNVITEDKYNQIRWIKASGEFSDEDVHSFNLKDIAAGDIVQIHYESSFTSDYGNNLFYFNSKTPKLQCEYDFTYRIVKGMSNYKFLLPVNIADSVVATSFSLSTDNITQVYKIKLENLQGINYFTNSFEGNRLPHVALDFNFTKIITGSIPDVNNRIYEYDFIRPKNFEWMHIMDTINHYTKIYDKHFATLRKFSAALPATGTDSSNAIFFKSLCDTFNAFRHLTSNHLFYNEQNLYAVSSDDHLFKRRIAGDSMSTLYRDILDDNNIFYYRANVQDKRYSEHNIHRHTHQAYESSLFAVPFKNSFIYFIPRYDGLKYHLNELPFYYENAIASLRPKNFQPEIKNKTSKFSKFIITHKSTYNDNTRTENSSVNISLTNGDASLMTKESLSGQFSTVLRHLYLNEYIDSTIAPYYFKKCTAKPEASDVKIKLSSKITEFPFRYTFNCSEKVKLENTKIIDLQNWFSFLVSKEIFPEKPNHDYYFDFEFSDAYNFLLNFDSPVDIKNSSAFSKNITNDFFELESEIVKNSESSYLIKVRLAVKQIKITEDQLDNLMQLTSELDRLNSFSLELVKK